MSATLRRSTARHVRSGRWFPVPWLRLFLVGLVSLVVAIAGALPAQAATYSYVSLRAVVTGSTVRATAVIKASSSRTVKAYGIVGDYEGYVSIALGVNGKPKFDVGELSNRIYLDVVA